MLVAYKADSDETRAEHATVRTRNIDDDGDDENEAEEQDAVYLTILVAGYRRCWQWYSWNKITSAPAISMTRAFQGKFP